MSQYLPKVAWSTIASNVTLGASAYRYYITVNPLDPNEAGASPMTVAVDDWFIDFAGYPFLIENVAGSVLTVYDILERGDGNLSAYAPYNGRLGYIYRPLNGAFLLTQAQLRKLDTSATDIIIPIEKGVAWSYRGVEVSTSVDEFSMANVTHLQFEWVDIVSQIDEEDIPGWQGGKKLIITPNLSFLNLNDTPDEYSANKFPVIKSDNTGIEFTDITESRLTLSDNTTANSSTDRHGFLPKLDGSTSTYMRGDGTWAVIMATTGDFLDSVIRMVIDNSYDPGTSHTDSDRFIILNSSSIHANFGTINKKIDGTSLTLGNNDIVQWVSSASEFRIVFDSSAAMQPATVTVGYDKNGNSNHDWTYNVTDDVWIDRGTTTLHNSLSDLNTGVGQYYHLTSDQQSLVAGITSSYSELNYLDGTTVTSGRILFGDGTKITNDSNFTWNNSTKQLTLSVATGTSPLVIASTTLVSNLNVDKVDGYDVQSTLIDENDRIMRVGSFGLGHYYISTESNFNNYRTGGFYITPSTLNTNIPSGWSSTGRNHLLIHSNDSVGYTFQILAGASNSVNKNKFAFRVSDSTGFSETWKELYHTGNSNLSTVDWATKNLTTNGTTTIQSLNGIILGTSGVLSALSSLNITYGGTGITSYTAGDLLYYSSGTSLSKFSPGVSAGNFRWNGSAWSIDTTTYLTNNQIITLSGDVTGSGSTSISTTLANSGVVAGTYNNVASQVRPFTVDAKGRLTNIGTAVNIQIAESQVINLVTDLANKQPLDATLTSLAAIAGVQGDLLYASGTDTWTRLAKSTTVNSFLKNSGTNNNPVWSTISTSEVSEGTNLYFTNARAISALLTGYTATSGTISATDSILQAIQKLGFDKHVAVTLATNSGLSLSGQQLAMGTPSSVTNSSTNSIINSTHTHAVSGLTNSNLSGSAGITNANLANSSLTIGSTSISLGGTSTTLSGLTSVTSTSFTGNLYFNGNGVMLSSLSSPTIGEISLVPNEMTNKLFCYDYTKFTYEYTTDDSTWNTWSISDADKKGILTANKGGTATITNGWLRSRITIESNSYVYLNNLYLYASTSGHSMSLTIQRSYDGSSWENVVADSGSKSVWPGRLFLSHSAIPWYPSPTLGVHYKYVRIIFNPTWNGSYPSNNITINDLEWFGGYPSAKREIYSWDYDKNVTFPATLTATGLTLSGLTASKVVFTDGSKNLTSTGIGTSSQFIKGNGSLDSNTYLTGNQTITLSGAVTGSGTTAITTSLATPETITGSTTNTGGTGAHTHAISLSFDNLTDVVLTTPTQGSVLYFNGTNWVNLAPGTNGYFLKTQGTGVNPVWAAVEIAYQTSVTSSSTPTPTGNYKENEYFLTNLATSATFAAPSGTPANGNTLLIRIKDNGTARTLSWNSIYRAVGVTLPTTTTISKTLYVGCIYNSTDSKWDVVSVVEQT